MNLRISSPVFVGRGEELVRLRAALEGAMSGRVGTTLIGGEAGVGKSRLLAEFRAGAASEGLRVLEGGCVDLGDGARPYDPSSPPSARGCDHCPGRISTASSGRPDPPSCS